MQANTIQSTLDSATTSVKTGKNNLSAAAPEFSFNQILDKEIFNSRAPDSAPTAARPAQVNTPAPAAPPNNSGSVNANAGNTTNNNNTATSDNNNSDAKVNDQAPASTPAPAKTDKTDKANSNEAKASDEGDNKLIKDDDIGSQIIALVGNLAATQANIDTSKKTVPTKTDAGKSDKLVAVESGASTDLTGIDTGSAKTGLHTLDKTPRANQSLALNPEQNKVDDTAGKADFATIANQLAAGKPDGKSVDKSLASHTKATAALPDKVQDKLTDAGISPNVLLTSTIKGSTANSKQSSDSADKAEKTVSTGDVKGNAIELNSKLIEKAADASTPAVSLQPLAKDVAQAHEVLPDRAGEITAMTAKDALQAAPPPLTAQAGINAAQFNAANALTSDQITPRVASPGWDKAVGQKVVWMVGEGLQSAELSLNPPDLGPLQVVLKVNNDQANASFTSAQPEVREALEAALPRLRQMLNDAGVQLSGFSVNSQAAGQSQQFAQQQPRTANPARVTENRIAADNTVSAATTSRITQTKSNDGLVDTFV